MGHPSRGEKGQPEEREAQAGEARQPQQGGEGEEEQEQEEVIEEHEETGRCVLLSSPLFPAPAVSFSLFPFLPSCPRAPC